LALGWVPWEAERAIPGVPACLMHTGWERGYKGHFKPRLERCIPVQARDVYQLLESRVGLDIAEEATGRLWELGVDQVTAMIATVVALCDPGRSPSEALHLAFSTPQ